MEDDEGSGGGSGGGSGKRANQINSCSVQRCHLGVKQQKLFNWEI